MTILGINVLHPILLAGLVLLPVLAAFYIYAFRTKDRLMARFAQPSLFRRLMPDVSRPRQRLKAVFVVAAIGLVIVALARPRYGYEWEEIKRKGVDIVVVLDLSTSMLAEDVEPSRLERAKRELADLLGMLEGDRLGLVAFAGTAFVQCPLTVDYRAFHLILDSLHPAMMPAQGTDLGQALGTAIQTFDEEKLSSKAIILISDGEDNEDKGMEAAERANELGIKIFAIGVGSESPAPVPSLDGRGHKRDPHSGEVVLTRFDEDGLKRIALATGGGYERSTTGDMDLQAIYTQDIKQGMEAFEIATSRSQSWTERYQWPLGLALLLLILEGLLPEVRRRNGAVIALLLALGIAAGTPAPAAADWWRNPFTPSPLRQGTQAYEDGDYAVALTHYQQAQLDRPDDRRLQFNIADSHYRLEDFEAAEQAFGRVLSLGADDKIAQRSYYNLGNTLYHQGRLEEAITAYEDALALDPDDEDALHNLEFVKQELGRREQECQRQQEQQEQQPPPRQKQEQEETQQEEQQQSAEPSEEQQGSEEEMANVDMQPSDSGDESMEAPPVVQLTPEEAERLLDALDERRPDIQRPRRNRSKDKDW
ncbi:MAG: VWA domain-containing protein [Myxococcota bacterium]|nr:VWA domain-containing protein [Myxococcota bacterium]